MSGCGDDRAPEQPTEWHVEEGHRWRELALPERGHTGFEPMSPERTGIEFRNRLAEEHLLRNQILSNGSGVAIGDVDGDGLADIYLARLDGPNALYRNVGGWRFEEVAADAGVDAPDRYSTGAVLADADGDGDPDLFLTALGGPVALFLNDGTGSFRDATEAVGLGGRDGSTTAALADVDGDGDLDLYVANYKRRSVNDLFPPEERTMGRTVVREGDRIEVAPAFREHYRVEWQGNRLRRYQIGEPDRMWLNDGEGGFEEVSFASGRFRDAGGDPLEEAPPDWGLAARFHDLDGDGDPDLYVCNDFESPDRMWLNDGEGRFRAVAPEALPAIAASCMTADFADVDLDGHLDLFAVDMLDRDVRRGRAQIPVVELQTPMAGSEPTTQQVQRNVLLLNRGDGTYAEAAHLAGVAASGWSWSAAFLDVDLDGDEDILIPNGHLHDVMDADTQLRLRDMVLEDWRRHILVYPPLRLRNVAFRNDGELAFTEVGEAWGFGPEEDISHGLATGDLDGDGDLDVVVNRMDAPALVLRNETVAPRVAVRLEGAGPNTAGIGARIRVLGGAVPDARKEVAAGGLYLSGSEPVHAFGTGEAEEVTIEVAWRSGARSRIEGARPNRLYVVREPSGSEAVAGEAGAPVGDDDRIAADAATPGGEAQGTARREPLFEPIAPAPDHLHLELPYNDFARQPLLPWRLSRLGPGVAWADVDGDGDPDLLVASGRGGALSLLRNDGGTLRRVVVRGGEAPGDQTTVLSLGGAGAGELLVGSMNYEAADPETARRLPPVLRVRIPTEDLGGEEVGVSIEPLLADQLDGVGPLALGDVDGDGVPDLFVGGRARPAAYPEPARSALYLRRGERFVPDTANEEALASLGLASAAVLSDVDGDGDLDLLVAQDWGPVALFENDAGRLRDRTEAWGLAGETGRWNGLATGDLDGDGRLDVVVTGWGGNTGLAASERRPLRMYWGDLDLDGTVETLLATWEPGLDGYAPRAGFDRLRTEVSGVAGRIGSHREYASSTVEDVLGDLASRARVAEARRLEHLLLLNRGGRFEAVPLPTEAQLAPAFHVGIADLDGDGHEDVFLAQNFSATDPDTEAYRSGRGLLLRGDGTGALRPVPGQRSGIEIYGDQRGAAVADVDGDGRLDLAVARNGAGVRVLRNAGGEPGLTVRLVGPPGNPRAIGATVRVEYADGRGPARELKAGSGYWSQDAATQVLGLRTDPVALWVRWPDGEETRQTLAPGQVRVTVSRGGEEGR